MQLKLESKYLSIKSVSAPALPTFAVLIGRNGVGKTQLLDAIRNGSVATVKGAVIEKYDISSFRAPSSEAASWGGSIAGSVTAQMYFHCSGHSGPEPLVQIAATVYKEMAKEFGLGEDGAVGARLAPMLQKFVADAVPR